MQRPVFVVAAQGYLYEWFPMQKEEFGASISASLTGLERIELLKSVIQHRDVFLPPIYEEWKKTKSER